MMMVVESIVGPKFPIGIQLGWALMTVKAIAYDSYHFDTHQAIQWPLLPYGCEHCPGRAHSHQDRNISPQDKGDRSEQLCIDLPWPLSLRGQVEPNHSSKMPPTA